MALKLTIPFPVFSPPNPSLSSSSTRRCPPPVIRFSRWNNANARPFEDRRRAQEEIEADIRRFRRFDSATRIAQVDENAAETSNPRETFRSAGTPSVPSSPSIPGRKSKYSKGEVSPFKRVSHVRRTRRARINDPNKSQSQVLDRKADVKLSEDGVSYVVDGAPFEFQYSYTETPKVRPLKLREPPYAPFGPTTMERPWTGRPPLPESKKKLREFDSFVLPPHGKKGVKPVQAPGPFVEGTGPRYVKTREEVLGEPLTKEEVKELVHGCLKTRRQLHMGRDGLTHNMLDNIHAHWKRRRVCKIKCLGVCTVDMDNVKQQLEERTGGKIIHSQGGVVFLFRGRNYNYRTRPRFPLMLWRPASPVYPRLIKRVPDGLTLTEATEMRRKGRDLIPICKLGKNGVYCDLVPKVQEAFQVCELVQINCQGMNPSDYRKIGGKLQDLVPCVLISFENEHILMWRGREPSPPLPSLKTYFKEENTPDVDDALTVQTAESCRVPSSAPTAPSEAVADEPLKPTVPPFVSEDAEGRQFSNKVPYPETEPNGSASSEIVLSISDRNFPEVIQSEENAISIDPKEYEDSADSFSDNASGESEAIESEILDISDVSEVIQSEDESRISLDPNKYEDGAHSFSDNAFGESETLESEKLEISDSQEYNGSPTISFAPRTEQLLLLLEKAVENGSALMLEESSVDADIVFQRAVALSRSAPPGPVFMPRPKKAAIQKTETKEEEDMKLDIQKVDFNATAVTSATYRRNKQEGKQSRRKTDRGDEQSSNPVSRGSLSIHELAKLLA